jgi:hypothetical protein
MISSLVVICLCFMDLAIKFNRQFFLATVKIGYKNPCAISELYAKRLLAPPTSPRLGGGREGALFLLFQRQSVLRPVG